MLAKQAPYLELVFVSGAYAFCWSYLFHLYIDNKTGVMGLPIITGDNNEERYNGVYEANWNYLSKRFITIVKARYKGMLPQKKQEHSLPLKKRFKDKFVGWFLWALAQLDLMRGQGITVKNAIIIIFSSVFSAGYIRDPVMKINYDLGLLFGSLVLFLTFYVFFVYLKNRKLEEWQVILTCAAYLCFFMSYSTVFYKYVPNILQAIIGGTFIYLPLFVLLEYFYTGRIPRINRFN